MYIENAYTQREQLSDRDLGRLLAALRDEAERYRHTIRNYPAVRMERHGKPYLAKIERRVAEVERLIEGRSHRSA